MTFLEAAMRDARITTDERGLMPLEDARRIAAELTHFEKAPSDRTPVLGADLAWAALLSLSDVREFLEHALRIEWAFHVRGHDNLAAHERYGDQILPWIAQAVDERGTLRNVPWCLYPCLLAIGTPDALDVAFLVQRTSSSLEPVSGPEADVADDLGAAPAWLAHRALDRLPIVAAAAREDPRCRALLARGVAANGVASIAALRPLFGDDECTMNALAVLRIPVPRTPPEIEAQLAGRPRADVPEGPPWSIVELDQEELFPYWDVLAGYETPYAVRVHGFACADGDVLFVQRICRSERGNEPCARYIGAYGPGSRGLDRAKCATTLVSPEDVSGTHLPAGVYIGLSEEAEIWGEADAWGVEIPGKSRMRRARNPMPHEGVLVRVVGTEDDLLIPWQAPAEWVEVAERAAAGGTITPEAMLRGIDPAEQVLLRLVSEHRQLLFLDEAQLRALASLPAAAELVFVVDDPELPETFSGRPPSAVAPWPLLVEALRRRVRLDPTRVERVDVLARRMRWTAGRGGAEDAWGDETSPTMEHVNHADALAARGWPHGVRLLHQHPHNDAAPAVFDWLVAQDPLPYSSDWPREVATRFVRHLGRDPDARAKGTWIFEIEARRILSDVMARESPDTSPAAAEHLTLLLEAFVGGPTLLVLVREILEALTPAQRAGPHSDAVHALGALRWVNHRIRSSAGRAAADALRGLAATLDPATDLGSALQRALRPASALDV